MKLCGAIGQTMLGQNRRGPSFSVGGLFRIVCHSASSLARSVDKAQNAGLHKGPALAFPTAPKIYQTV